MCCASAVASSTSVCTHAFDGHFVEVRSDVRVIHPGYWERSHKREGAGIHAGGLRSRVGARDIPLSHFINVLLRAGLTLERVEEPPRR